MVLDYIRISENIFEYLIFPFPLSVLPGLGVCPIRISFPIILLKQIALGYVIYSALPSHHLPFSLNRFSNEHAKWAQTNKAKLAPFRPLREPLPSTSTHVHWQSIEARDNANGRGSQAISRLNDRL